MSIRVGLSTRQSFANALVMEDEVVAELHASHRSVTAEDPTVLSENFSLSAHVGLDSDRWSFMYCGGGGKVVDPIGKIAKEHYIPLSVFLLPVQRKCTVMYCPNWTTRSNIKH
jgi:hypothetical protein